MWDLSVIQVAQTPQSKKGAKAMEKYVRDLRRVIDDTAPWLREEGKVTRNRKSSFNSPNAKSKRERLQRPPESKVIIENSDNSIPKSYLDFFAPKVTDS